MDIEDGARRSVYLIGRRRPSVAVVAYRWRYETGAASALAAGWLEFGTPWTGVIGGAVAGVAACTAWPGPRSRLVRVVQHVVVQHRVRTGLLQCGLANRDGRLPRVTRTRTRGEAVRMSLRLPAGIAPEDVAAEAHRLSAACGAAEVHVLSASPSRDRVEIVVVRPRWGMPGR